MAKLIQTNSGYTYNEQSFSTFTEGVVCMLHDFTFSGVEYGFKDIKIKKLSTQEAHIYFVLRAIQEMDLSVLLTAKDYHQYKKFTNESIENGTELFKYNPFYVSKMDIPSGYECNKVMQMALCPTLSGVYNKRYAGRFKFGKRVYDYTVMISWMLDKILFKPATTPFKEGLDIMLTLDKHPRTNGLSDYLHNEDIKKARILAMQAKAGDLDVGEDKILLNDLRKSSYTCKSKELWGSGEYVSILLNLPQSKISDDYYTWLNNAAKAFGRDLGLDTKEASEDYTPQFGSHERTVAHEEPKQETPVKEPERVNPAKEPTQETPVKQVVTPTKSAESSLIRDAAIKYCEASGMPFEAVDIELSKHYTNDKEKYYALRRYFSQVNMSALVEYLNVLYDVYGSTGINIE